MKFPDDQVECPAPSPKLGVLFDDETADIGDFQYGSIIRYLLSNLKQFIAIVFQLYAFSYIDIIIIAHQPTI